MTRTLGDWRRATVPFALVLSGVLALASLVSVSDVHAQGTGKPKTDSATATEPQLADDLEEAIRVVEKGDFKTFLERYAPVEMLRQLRQQDLFDRASVVMAAQPQTKTQLVAILKALQKQTPKYDKSRGLATIQFDTIANGIEAAPIVTGGTLKEELTLTGMGGDLKKVLAGASELLAAGDVQQFVEQLFPVSELARLQEPGAMQDLVHQIKAKPEAPKPAKPKATPVAESPSLLGALQNDFKLLQTLTPEMTDNGQVAVFQISSAYHPVRKIKFQKKGNDWRLFDDAPRVTAELARQSKLKPPSAITTVTMERIGGNWRFIELPALQMRGR